MWIYKIPILVSQSCPRHVIWIFRNLIKCKQGSNLGQTIIFPPKVYRLYEWTRKNRNLWHILTSFLENILIFLFFCTIISNRAMLITEIIFDGQKICLKKCTVVTGLAYFDPPWLFLSLFEAFNMVTYFAERVSLWLSSLQYFHLCTLIAFLSWCKMMILERFFVVLFVVKRLLSVGLPLVIFLVFFLFHWPTRFYFLMSDVGFHITFFLGRTIFSIAQVLWKRLFSFLLHI